MRRKKKKPSSSSLASHPPESLPTFMDHVYELRSRLMWTILWFVAVTGILFPFFNQVIHILMRPLGNEKLYYLTPIGGISFAIKVCMYVGLVATLPVAIYHLFRFISPVMKRNTAKDAVQYVFLSTILAASGIAFAYLVTLPAALRFLTNFNIQNVSAMVTVDSYLSFIVVYLLAGAVMFQIPLIMAIVDNISPRPPSQWNHYQKHMIVGAFIIGMLLSPSPEITTQFMLALPIILMYQFGILLVWFNHHRARSHLSENIFAKMYEHDSPSDKSSVEPTNATQARRQLPSVGRSMDGMTRAQRSGPVIREDGKQQYRALKTELYKAKMQQRLKDNEQISQVSIDGLPSIKYTSE